jgi:hypothetical protein
LGAFGFTSPAPTRRKSAPTRPSDAVLEPFFTFEGSSGAIALSGGCINADTAVTFPFEQRLGRIADKLQPVKSRTGLARFFQRLVGAGKYRERHVRAERLGGVELTKSSTFVDCCSGRLAPITSLMRKASSGQMLLQSHHHCLRENPITG